MFGYIIECLSIDREDEQETPPGEDRLTNLNTTFANNNKQQQQNVSDDISPNNKQQLYQ